VAGSGEGLNLEIQEGDEAARGKKRTLTETVCREGLVSAAAQPAAVRRNIRAEKRTGARGEAGQGEAPILVVIEAELESPPRRTAVRKENRNCFQGGKDLY